MPAATSKAWRRLPTEVPAGVLTGDEVRTADSLTEVAGFGGLPGVDDVVDTVNWQYEVEDWPGGGKSLVLCPVARGCGKAQEKKRLTESVLELDGGLKGVR
jgi:hypothetical protein